MHNYPGSDDDELMETTNSIDTPVHDMEPQDISIEDFDASEVTVSSTASVKEAALTLAQMEENLQQLREKLGKFT